MNGIKEYMREHKRYLEHETTNRYGYKVNFLDYGLPQPVNTAELSPLLGFLFGCADARVELVRVAMRSPSDPSLQRIMKVANLLGSTSDTAFSKHPLAEAVFKMVIPTPDTELDVSNTLQSLFGCVWFSEFVVFNVRESNTVDLSTLSLADAKELMALIHKNYQRGLGCEEVKPVIALEVKVTMLAHTIGDAVRLQHWQEGSIRPAFQAEFHQLQQDVRSKNRTQRKIRCSSPV